MSDIYYGDPKEWEKIWQETVEKLEQEMKPKCECGASKTMGTGDNPIFHSFWCEIRKRYEKTLDKK